MPNTGFQAYSPVEGIVFWTAPPAFRATADVTASVTWTAPEETPRRRMVGLSRIVKNGYIRGTYGLMPREWGVVEDFDLDETAAEFAIRAPGKLIAVGQHTGTLTISMTLRMPYNAPLPYRGQQFVHRWQGADRTFTVWSVGKAVGLRTLQRVPVTARHELDLGNVAPVETAAEVVTISVS